MRQRPVLSFVRDPDLPRIRCCYVCGVPRPGHSIGWETLIRTNLDAVVLCPRHRQERPAMATLGELSLAHQKTNGRSS